MSISLAKTLFEQGQEHLSHCNLGLARTKFLEAAQLYWGAARSLKAKGANTNMLNAAICYHLANDDKKVVEVVDNINHSRLSEKDKKAASDLYEEARKRTRSSYWDTKNHDLKEMCEHGEHKSILATLKDNPWLLESHQLARQMRDSCIALGMKEVAALFDQDLRSILDYD